MLQIKTSARESPISPRSLSSSFPAWPTKGRPCLSSLAPGRLANEHQVGVGVAGAEDHGLAGLGQLGAACAAAGLLPHLLQALPALAADIGADGTSGLGRGTIRRGRHPANCGGRTCRTPPYPAFAPTGISMRELDWHSLHLALIGPGRLGRALAPALAAAGCAVTGPLGPGRRPPPASTPSCSPCPTPRSPRPPRSAPGGPARRPLLGRHRARRPGRPRGLLACTR